MQRTFQFYADSGHGWLKVPILLIKNLGLQNQAGGYMTGTHIYWEEDSVTIFLEEYEKQTGQKAKVKDAGYTDGESVIRNYCYYRPHWVVNPLGEQTTILYNGARYAIERTRQRWYLNPTTNNRRMYISNRDVFNHPIQIDDFNENRMVRASQTLSSAGISAKIISIYNGDTTTHTIKVRQIVPSYTDWFSFTANKGWSGEDTEQEFNTALFFMRMNQKVMGEPDYSHPAAKWYRHHLIHRLEKPDGLLLSL